MAHDKEIEKQLEELSTSELNKLYEVLMMQLEGSTDPEETKYLLGRFQQVQHLLNERK